MTSDDKDNLKNIKHVRATWADNSNILRCRVIPIKRFVQDDFSVSLTSAIQSLPCMFDQALNNPAGEVLLFPDKSSLKVLPWIPSSAIVFGNMISNGKSWDLCPRTFLQNKQNELYDTFGLKMNVGFEIEFVVFQDEIPIDSSLYCEMKSLYGNGWLFLEEIVNTLELLGIPLWQYHSESACGQFEISIGPFKDDLVAAADALCLTRLVIGEIAHNFGFSASMIPKPFPMQAGNSNHCHFSFSTIKNPAMDPSLMMKQFMAGILDKLSALCLITVPTVSSYQRLQPKCWAGAYCCWGIENKEAPIRLIGDPTQFERFELKMVDGTSNPYLALGCVLSLGMHGLRNQLKLGDPINVDPANLPLGKQPFRIPTSLSEAIDAFKSELNFWNHVMGKNMSDLLIRLRSAENEYYSSMNQIDMVSALSKRY